MLFGDYHNMLYAFQSASNFANFYGQFKEEKIVKKNNEDSIGLHQSVKQFTKMT